MSKKTFKATGAAEIATERKEQINKHGYTFEHDNIVNAAGQIGVAASSLIIPEVPNVVRDNPPYGWDRGIWQTMCMKPLRDRLVIAGALIAAQIDNIDYKKHLADADKAASN